MGADGLMGRRGALVKAQKSGAVLGGGEGDQCVIGASSEDLIGGHCGEEFLVAVLGQGEEGVSEALGERCPP
jgi:hypothetical protein